MEFIIDGSKPYQASVVNGKNEFLKLSVLQWKNDFLKNDFKMEEIIIQITALYN